MKKIIWPGLLVGVSMLLIGFAISYLFMLFPSVAADYQNPNMMRSQQDPLMLLFLWYPFLSGIIFAWAWQKTKTLFSGKAASRGMRFGLMLWLIAGVPGMFVTYTSFPFAFLTVFSWLVAGLINDLVAGMLLAKLNK